MDNNFEEKIKEAMNGFNIDEQTNQITILTSGVINEAYLKTMLSLGIDILSKLDSSKTREEHRIYYVTKFSDYLADTLASKAKHTK